MKVSSVSKGLANEPVTPVASRSRASVSPATRPRSRPRAITYSTLSVDRVKQVLQAYDVDQPIEGTIFHRSMSDTYYLSTPQQQFALKVYTSNWRSREAIAQELAAIRHAYSKGVSVALPVARRDGELITTVRAPEGSRCAVLFIWARGRTPKYSNPMHAYQFGRMLAQLHVAMDDFKRYSERPSLDLDYLFRTPVDRIMRRLGDLPEVAVRFDNLVTRIEERLRTDAAQLPDWGFCHGDVHVYNTRIDGDRLVLFDFDYFGQGWRISDLATYRWQARCNGAEATAWPAFLQGYAEVRPRIAESLRFARLFMMLKHLWDKGRFIAFAEQFDPITITEEFLENAVGFCEQLEAEAVET